MESYSRPMGIRLASFFRYNQRGFPVSPVPLRREVVTFYYLNEDSGAKCQLWNSSPVESQRVAEPRPSDQQRWVICLKKGHTRQTRVSAASLSVMVSVSRSYCFTFRGMTQWVGALAVPTRSPEFRFPAVMLWEAGRRILGASIRAMVSFGISERSCLMGIRGDQ